MWFSKQQENNYMWFSKQQEETIFIELSEAAFFEKCTKGAEERELIRRGREAVKQDEFNALVDAVYK